MHNEIMNLFTANPRECLKSFHDLIMQLEIKGKKNPFLGIFAAPRSASRFTSVILALCLQLKEINVLIVEESGGHELLNQVNEIDYVKLLYHGPENHLIHAHLMANPLTLRAIKRLQIIPIVTRRSIPDSLISLRHEIERQWASLLEHINKRGFITTFFGAVSSRTVNKFLNSPFEYKMDFLIDVCSPWYFLFLESWENAAEKGRYG